MPAATSALVGVYPTRGLVSIAGIAPLDWLLDNTGRSPGRRRTPRCVEVMAGPDPPIRGPPARRRRRSVRHGLRLQTVT